MNLHRKNLEFIKKLSELFSEFSSLTSLYELDAINCIEKLSLMPVFSSLRFLFVILKDYYIGCNMRELWINSVNNFCPLPFYMREIKELLISFSDTLGKYSREEFSAKCILFSEKIRKIYEAEAEKWEKNRSLHLGTGVFTAAAVFIIFI